MILFWALLATSTAFLLLSGGQAVRLLSDRDGDISRLGMQITTLQGDQDRTQQQIEAQRIQLTAQRALLEQTERWIEAQQRDAKKTAH